MKKKKINSNNLLLLITIVLFFVMYASRMRGICGQRFYPLPDLSEYSD